VFSQLRAASATRDQSFFATRDGLIVIGGGRANRLVYLQGTRLSSGLATVVCRRRDVSARIADGDRSMPKSGGLVLQRGV